MPPRVPGFLSLAFGVLLIGATGPAGAALVIDDFESGGFTLNTPGGSATEAGLPVLGGTRDAALNFSGVSATGHLVSWAGDRMAVVSVLPQNLTQAYGASLTFTYDAGATTDFPTNGVNVDLTQGGQNDRFRVDVDDATNGSFWIVVGDRSGRVTWPLFVHGVTAGTHDLLFSAGDPWDIDFTNIAFVRINITTQGNVGSNSNASIAIGSFSVVPEPASLVVAGATLISLPGRRRGR